MRAGASAGPATEHALRGADPQGFQCGRLPGGPREELDLQGPCRHLAAER